MGQALMRTTATLTSLLLAATAATTTAAAAHAQPAQGHAARTGASARATGAVQSITPLPIQPLHADGRSHTFAVRSRNTSPAPRNETVQILLVSPGLRPALDASEVRLEKLNPASGTWTAVRLASQTGTLYTPIPRAGETLATGGELVVRYRITVLDALPVGAPRPVLQPQIVSFTGLAHRPAA